MRCFLLLPLLAGCLADADSKLDTAPGDTDPGGETGDPVSASFVAAFRVDAEGSGDDRVDSARVEENRVELILEGAPHRGLAYQHHDWQSAGYVLFDLITVAEDGSNLAVTYLYGQGDLLPYAYTESFLHPMDWESTSGSVAWSEQPTEVEPSIPALEARPDPTDLGVTIAGDALWLEGAAGGVTVDGVGYELLPFASVDCTDCPGGPWLELHSLLVEGADACFGIVYLFPEEPGYAQLSYGFCLGSLSTLEGSYEVDWSGSLPPTARAWSAGGPPVGRPPRRRP
jgi:hypothetical protein